MIAKYRKKPVVIEAVQYFPRNHVEVLKWIKGHDKRVIAYINPDNELIIETLEGPHIAPPGWFIIRGVKGEFYPCEPEIFALTYEEVDHEQA